MKQQLVKIADLFDVRYGVNLELVNLDEEDETCWKIIAKI